MSDLLHEKGGAFPLAIFGKKMVGGPFKPYFGLSVIMAAHSTVPQRLKPSLAERIYGTAEAVPFVQSVFPQPV
jgi:hypothetical protein